MTPLALIPAAILSFLGGACLGTSRRGLSMLRPGRGSPIPGVPAASWRRFVAIMVTSPRGLRSPRGRFGCFGMDARRLADVGFMTGPKKIRVGDEVGVWSGEWVPPLTEASFLGSAPAQYEAFCRSMRSLAPRVAPHVGKIVDGSRASLSGLLAAGHLAGEAGVAGWVRDPETRKRFRATTENFRRANSIF